MANTESPRTGGELEALRQQLELERGLREAADTENEQLQAQVEAYAEDMAALYQEQHGRGKDGLAAEAAGLRAQLADESAQREVIARLHKRSVERTRELSDQLATAGEDVSRAFRQGKRAAASGGGPWWRKATGFVPIATTVAGLLIGAGGYATLAPTPTPTATTLSADGSLYGPALPTQLSGSGIIVASGGRLQPLAPGPAGSTDPAGMAATAAAAAFAPVDASLQSASGASAAAAAATPLPSALVTTPTPSGGVDATATAVASVAAAARSSPSPAGIPAQLDLGPTVTAFAATGTALAGIATAAAATAAARAFVTPLPTATPTLVVLELPPAPKKERCRFELLLPVLAPGAAYAIQFQQRAVADVVILWSDQAGVIELDRLGANGAPRPLGLTTESPGQSVVARNAEAGSYRARLVNRGGEAADTRVALFYDIGAVCLPVPRGAPIDAPPGAVQPAAGTPSPTAAPPTTTPVPPTLAPSTATPVPSTTAPVSAALAPSTAAPAPLTATPPSAAASAVPSATSAPAQPSTAASATPVPLATDSATPVAALSIAPATPLPRSPTPVPPTATPVRPYIDCRPYLRGPSGVLLIRPRVWMDTAHTVLGSWPMRVTLTGPGINQSADFTATPNGDAQQLRLGGYGGYRLNTEANGADLDPNCSWNFEHTRYA